MIQLGGKGTNEDNSINYECIQHHLDKIENKKGKQSHKKKNRQTPNKRPCCRSLANFVQLFQLIAIKLNISKEIISSSKPTFLRHFQSYKEQQ